MVNQLAISAVLSLIFGIVFLVKGRVSNESNDEKTALDPSKKKKLRALGYILVVLAGLMFTRIVFRILAG